MYAISRVRTVSFSLLLVVANGSFAQSSASKFEAGLNLGAFVYQGDLVSKRIGSLKTLTPGVGISFARVLSPSFSLRAAFKMASLKADDTKYADESVNAYRQFRAFKANTRVREISVQGKWLILGSSEFEKFLDPYIFAGAGLSFIKARRDYSAFSAPYFSETETVESRLATDLTEKENRTIPIFPAGAGVTYHLSPAFDLNLEFTYRFTASDYIDGYSIAANPKLNDHYWSQTAGIVYRFPRKNGLRCPSAN